MMAAMRFQIALRAAWNVPQPPTVQGVRQARTSTLKTMLVKVRTDDSLM